MRINGISPINQSQQKSQNFGAIGIKDFLNLPREGKQFIKVAERHHDLLEIGLDETYNFVAIVKTEAGSELENTINKDIFDGQAILLDDMSVQGYIDEYFQEFKQREPNEIEHLLAIVKKTIARAIKDAQNSWNHIVDNVLGTEKSPDWYDLAELTKP